MEVQERPNKALKALEMGDQCLLQVRADTLQRPQPQTGLATLPTELVDRIFEYVDVPQSILPFLFSRIFYKSAVRVLYRDLRIEICSAVVSRKHRLSLLTFGSSY